MSPWGGCWEGCCIRVSPVGGGDAVRSLRGDGGVMALTPHCPPTSAAIRERPNSAIYPSESFRQTLLGPRRGRPSLSLSKSVSTTNIAG